MLRGEIWKKVVANVANGGQRILFFLIWGQKSASSSKKTLNLSHSFEMLKEISWFHLLLRVHLSPLRCYFEIDTGVGIFFPPTEADLHCNCFFKNSFFKNWAWFYMCKMTDGRDTMIWYMHIYIWTNTSWKQEQQCYC